MAYIEGKNLCLGYEGKAIVENLNFKVEKGDYLCIVGENGSGKSTLMKTLLGLTPAIGGEIILGEDISKKEIGYLPQATLVQKDFPATVMEIVLSGCQGRMGLRPFYGKEEKEQAYNAMEKMGITALSKKSYRDLSGGQQQRVLLARALCATKKLLILDEPVAALDPLVTAQMYELIEKLNKEGITIIMISHDVFASLKYASHILHMDKEIFFGSTEEYLNSSVGKRFVVAEEKLAEDVITGGQNNE